MYKDCLRIVTYSFDDTPPAPSHRDCSIQYSTYMYLRTGKQFLAQSRACRYCIRADDNHVVEHWPIISTSRTMHTGIWLRTGAPLVFFPNL